MKYIKFFNNYSNDFPKNKEDVMSICEKYSIANYTINEDFSIDVDGDVDVELTGYSHMNILPIKFNKVTGYFLLRNLSLDTLEGCPNWVGSNFIIFKNKSYLIAPDSIKKTEINHLPKYIGCDLIIKDSFISKINNIPNYIGGDVCLEDNLLTTLDGFDGFYISNCSDNPIYDLRNHTNIEFYSTPIHKLISLLIRRISEYIKLINNETYCYVIIDRLSEFEVLDDDILDFIKLEQMCSFYSDDINVNDIITNAKMFGYKIK